ncbi:AAA family ATPase [Bacillus thuringiensis]|uniref:AAA family ATPase n=1 Tax=Bacillus thuringiensis TaxID=1428 RepID=UPI0011A126A4|nr:AAA family ATPase [Bacillus thuringiensis]
MLIYFLASSGDSLVNQDINFDSEFHITYNQVTKELSIEKNYNYIENFWGENIISLSAIVGKNGVGKSSILELLKDRFFRGMGITNETIMIYKEQKNLYKLYYNEGLFNEGKIKINGKNYDVNSYIFEKNESAFIKIDELDFSIQLFKAPSNPKINRKKLIDLETTSRIAKNSALINYTYYWNYSRRLRSLDIESNTKGLEYFDYSIANKLDSVLRDKDKPQIVDIENIDKINTDQRFGINYLYQLNEKDIYNTLTYLKDEKNRGLLKQYFMVPEELYIYYDYLDSEKRANSFLFDLNNTNEYLRYEDRSRNYQLEDLIYDFLLKNNSKKIQLREAILLRVYDSFFTEIQGMFSSEDIQKDIREMDEIYFNTIKIISNDEDLEFTLLIFKRLIIKAIKKVKANEIMKQKNTEILYKNFISLSDGYYEFLNFIEYEFCKTVESTTIAGSPRFEKDIDGTVSVSYQDIEIPKIKLDNKGIEIALTLFNKYKNIGTNSKILYFVWRNLSSGQMNILNLLTSLNAAIEKSEKKYILILLDEAEVSLHPTWQKNYIKLLIDNIGAKAEEENKKVQIILTTHSPFVLSDIPTDRVVFLDEEPITKKVYTKKSLDDQPLTFGSNIHDLYMNSFFLEGGLMGDYAKQKINEIANKLINYNPKQKQEIKWEDIRKLINQIGEPIIRTRLVEIYDQKRILNQDFIPNNVEDTISKIQNEIKKLQSEIQILKESGDELDSY